MASISLREKACKITISVGNETIFTVSTWVRHRVGATVLNEDDRSEVSHIGTGAVAGVLLLNIFVDHTAHPFNAVATT